MKKFISLLALILVGFTGISQVYTEINNAGTAPLKQIVRTHLGIPSDTLPTLTSYEKQFPAIAAKHDTIFVWDVLAQYWRVASGTGGSPASMSFVDITYSALQTKISGSTLLQGTRYRITDYKTVYTILGTAQIDSASSAEPLVVTALSTNKIAPEAYSPSHPDDIIYYSPDDNTVLSPATNSYGVILFRMNVTNRLSSYYDWRVIKWRRWALATGAAYFAYTSGTPAISADDYSDILTFGTNCRNVEIGMQSYNVIIANSANNITIGKQCGSSGAGIYIGTSAHAIRIADECSTIQTSGSGYVGGIYIGSSSRYVNIGSRSYNIAIGSNCYALDLGLQNSDVFVADTTWRRRIEKGFSNFEVTLNLDTDSTIDLYNTNISVLGAYLYGSANYCGIIKVTSPNAEENIERISAQITSLAYHDIRIFPESGLKLNFIPKSEATVDGANIDLNNTIVVDGTKGQYISLTKYVVDSVSGTGAQRPDWYLAYSNAVKNLYAKSPLYFSGPRGDTLVAPFYDSSKVSNDSVYFRIEGEWEFVVKLPTAATTTASNGLTKTGNDIRTGGNITQNTTVTNTGNFDVKHSHGILGTTPYYFSEWNGFDLTTNTVSSDNQNTAYYHQSPGGWEIGYTVGANTNSINVTDSGVTVLSPLGHYTMPTNDPDSNDIIYSNGHNSGTSRWAAPPTSFTLNSGNGNTSYGDHVDLGGSDLTADVDIPTASHSVNIGEQRTQFRINPSTHFTGIGDLDGNGNGNTVYTDDENNITHVGGSGVTEVGAEASGFHADQSTGVTTLGTNNPSADPTKAHLSINTTAGTLDFVAPGGITGLPVADIADGTFTPTMVFGGSGVGNCSSVTAGVCQYLRVGKIVTMSGRLSVTATNSAVNFYFTMTVPTGLIDNAFSGSAAGTGISDTPGTSISIANTSTTEVICNGKSLNTSATYYYFTCTYRIQ